MDTDWTVSSSSWYWEEDKIFRNSYWTREEDKAFENALALYHDDPNQWEKIAEAVPGKTIEDLKLHYEDLRADVVAIESGDVPLPKYPNNVSVPQMSKKPPRRGVKRGIPWSVKQHRQFLEGLEKYGKGDWKSIARNCVAGKTNSQVASHAQKYFKRLKLGSKKGKRPSINDIRTVHPETTPPAVEEPALPVYPKGASTSIAPFGGVTSGPQFASSQAMMMSAEADPGLPAWSMFVGPYGSQPIIQEPVCSSAEMMSAYCYYHPRTERMVQESGGVAAASYGSFDIPFTSEFGDLDVEEFVLPHFLD
ncbi:hypothetical protein ABFS83_14G308100 [Erythranthe nasuta]|uniref:HTH myb-type domain-containing protein n=1 Tax=Erythranthe guttata TaxID=4155 RepID=A0A022Q9B5_ERYGU|nr:PREDICTED: transcription factor DIVARICATA-like [Erythranthe guttata]EYU23843.1 hypothetical protein MIMGU_mgv1a010639mg [Erythranthe guttata]|eukprot:XP_012853388.1 PREDICTED: transcription factor DIVARICATA-like [Erythranthe guttata]